MADTRALKDSFPELYRSMLGSPFERDLPREVKATCDSCAMVEGNATATVPPVDGVSRFFRPDTKCCTFHPRLPNYLVGAILADDDPQGAEGRGRMEARVASGVGVTPQWLHPPRAFSFVYEHSRGAFGRARGLRCPFFAVEDGGCTIWRHRDAVCSTWFCKYVAGEDGRRLWTAAKELLSLVEIQLARAALLELFPEALDGGARASGGSAPLGPGEIDGDAPSAAERAVTWGRWAGRETELYVRCCEWVRAVTAPQLQALLGLDGIVARRTLSRAIDAAESRTLPPVLMLDPAATIRWLPDGTIALAAYSEHEGVALPAAAHALLVRFTGETPVSEVRARLRAEASADLADEVLLELYRQRILVEPGRRQG